MRMAPNIFVCMARGRGPADTADISGVGAQRLLGLATFVLTQAVTATRQHGDVER